MMSYNLFLNIFVDCSMRMLDYRWIGKYGENMLVHDPSIGNSTAKTLIILGFTVEYPLFSIM